MLVLLSLVLMTGALLALWALALKIMRSAEGRRARLDRWMVQRFIAYRKQSGRAGRPVGRRARSSGRQPRPRPEVTIELLGPEDGFDPSEAVTTTGRMRLIPA